MEAIQVFWIFLSVLASGVLVYFSYYHRQELSRDLLLLPILRFLTWFGLLLLLINPKVRHRDLEEIKPQLFLAADNSTSIATSGFDSLSRTIINELAASEAISNRFEVFNYRFDQGLALQGDLDFQGKRTDIHQALEGLNAMGKNKEAAIVLLTDGNQTYGSSYSFSVSDIPVFPVVLGDTLSMADLLIPVVNVNAYATMGNTFEVEVFMRFEGGGEVQSRLRVEKEGEELYTGPVKFTAEDRSSSILLRLSADKAGKQVYRTQLTPFDGEKNTRNNLFVFEVEVIDEQSRVGVVYDVLHPDLGTIRRSLESNPKRKVELVPASQFDGDKNAYDLLVLYQPNENFKGAFSYLERTGAGYFLIAGTETNWKVVNASQNALRMDPSKLTESFLPEYNAGFGLFYSEDIGFSELPSLEGNFGKPDFMVPVQTILYKSVDGILTESPLLAAYEESQRRRIALFGEGLWKWRIRSFEKQGSFSKFDAFMSGLVQYLQVPERSDRMELYYETMQYADQPVSIRAKKYDSNLGLDQNARLVLTLEDDLQQRPMFYDRGMYYAEINDLEEGEYSFQVADLSSGDKKNGVFQVVPYTLEEQFDRANTEDLLQLARRSGGKMYFPGQVKDLASDLLADPKFKVVQKENKKWVSLIDWKWLLGLIVLSLALEWFVRKYRGML